MLLLSLLFIVSACAPGLRDDVITSLPSRVSDAIFACLCVPFSLSSNCGDFPLLHSQVLIPSPRFAPQASFIN